MAGEFRKGDAKPRRFTFTASTAIERGDLVYQDSSTKKILPASSFTWDTSIGVTQHNFNDYFAGVSNIKRLSSQTDTPEGIVCTGGIFEFNCAALSAALETGTLFGPAKASGNALENQKVVQVGNANLAIGWLAQPAASGATTVLIEIQSSIAYGGVQAQVT